MAATKPTRSILTDTHTLKDISLLTREHVILDRQPAFKTFELYPHQQTLVRAMADLEDRRSLNVTTESGKVVQISTSAIMLSEPFGCGKTLIILALISHRPIPRATPLYCNYLNIPNTQVRNAPPMPLFLTEVKVTFKGQSLIRPNLIVIGTAVVTYWQEQIETQTNLSVFAITDAHSLRVFKSLYESGDINTYDIVLLKNGNVTGNFRLDTDGDKPTPSLRSMLYMVSMITREKIWPRVVYDDMDTIHIPQGSPMINALFTIFVSATTKESAQSPPPAVTYSDLTVMLRDTYCPVTQIMRDSALFTAFNVRNCAKFTEESTRITILLARKYVYANPGDRFIGLLGAMKEDDAVGIMEMLNGDAISKAADALGIVTTSVADIFTRMLGKKYERFMHDGAVLQQIASTSERAHSLAPHTDGRQHSRTDLEHIRVTLTKAKSPKLTYSSQALTDLCEELAAEWKQIRHQDGLAIERVKDNIKEGDCQVCALPLRKDDIESDDEGASTAHMKQRAFNVFIMRCCGIVVCDDCGIRCNNIRMQYDYATKSQALIGSCANCKFRVDPRTDLIFVDQNVDIEGLLRPCVTVALPEENSAADSEPALVVPEVRNPKIKAILAIVRGEQAENMEVFEPNIPQLMHGSIDAPMPADTPRKVMIFANYDDTLALVENALVEHGISFVRLCGGVEKRAETVKMFREKCQVMLVNSQQTSSGLHLAFATDLIYYHRIVDVNIEAQVAGRLQRIGRKYNGTIHYLAYNNENEVLRANAAAAIAAIAPPVAAVAADPDNE